MSAWLTRKPVPQAARVEPRPAPGPAREFGAREFAAGDYRNRQEPRLSFAAYAPPADRMETERLAAAAQAFAPYRPPVGVRGAQDPSGLAQDAAMALPPGFGDWAADHLGQLESYMADGLNFQGYPTLAQMMQRAEFRKPVEVLAKECTREWIRFRGRKQTRDRADNRDAARRLVEIEKAFRDFGVRDIIYEQIRQGLGYGVGHVWADVAGGGASAEPGAGPGASAGMASQDIPLRVGHHGMGKGALRRFANIEPIWTTPAAYNADTPLHRDFYRPSLWWVQGARVHASRMKSLVPFPVSQMLLPAFNFGGLSLTQQIKTYVHDFLRIRNNVTTITANFSKLVLLTDMFGSLQAPQSGVHGPGVNGGGLNTGSLTGRAHLLQTVSDGQDIIIADKEREDAKILATPLTGLNELLVQAMKSMAAIPGIPLIKLLGIQPSGFNASSDGEIRVFYDEIAAWQKAQIEPTLRWMFHLIQVHLWGDIDPDLDFDFVHLWQMDEKQAAEISKLKAETDAINIGAGKIAPDEAREREAADDTGFYRNVNLTGPAPKVMARAQDEARGGEAREAGSDAAPAPAPGPDSGSGRACAPGAGGRHAAAEAAPSCRMETG